MRTVSIEPLSSSGLPTLTITPESNRGDAPVLLLLHGMREAGSSPSEVPKVCIHQSPPWRAMMGRIPDALVIAPQAPSVPNEETWNWGDHATSVGHFLKETFEGRRLVATGFTRGGLGVLQVLAAYPNLFERWAIADPQPPSSKRRRQLSWPRRHDLAGCGTVFTVSDRLNGRHSRKRWRQRFPNQTAM